MGVRKEEMEVKLKRLRNEKVKPVSRKERECMEMEFRKWEKVRNKRRKCFAEVEASLVEQGLKRDELWVSYEGIDGWSGTRDG